MSVHWSIRYSAFALSVWTLSLFFAGWRMINTEGSLCGFLTLAGGVLFTSTLLFMQGYWIYFDEKNKGTLRRTIRVYDKLYVFLEQRIDGNRFVRLIQPVVSEGKGSDQ